LCLKDGWGIGFLIRRRNAASAVNVGLRDQTAEEDAMMTRVTILAFALVGVASVAQAQSRPPLDPYGRPYVSSAPQPTPGDPGTMAPSPRAMDAAPQMAPSRAMAPEQPAFKDEYGNRYNSRGDRIDAAGRIMPPPVTPPGAPALR
jgi:hypothetical protein